MFRQSENAAKLAAAAADRAALRVAGHAGGLARAGHQPLCQGLADARSAVRCRFRRTSRLSPSTKRASRVFGRFPWPRQVLAKAIDALSAAGAKVIAVDVLFPDPTTQEDDEALWPGPLGDAGNVVLAAQLIDSPVHGGPATWLMPMPALAHAAAGVGHVNVAGGIGRRRAADRRAGGRRCGANAARHCRWKPSGWPTGTPERERLLHRQCADSRRSADSAGSVSGAVAHRPDRLAGAHTICQTGRMTIDYIGPAGSFDPVTYSAGGRGAWSGARGALSRQVRADWRDRRQPGRSHGLARSSIRPMPRRTSTAA